MKAPSSIDAPDEAIRSEHVLAALNQFAENERALKRKERDARLRWASAYFLTLLVFSALLIGGAMSARKKNARIARTEAELVAARGEITRLKTILATTESKAQDILARIESPEARGPRESPVPVRRAIPVVAAVLSYFIPIWQLIVGFIGHQLGWEVE